MKSAIALIIAILMAVGTRAAEQAFQLSADRAIIYTQKLDLNGGETLLDILRIYPDLMQEGFDNMLDGYNLRINNGPVNGDTRLLCSKIPASAIAKIQICDNSAVAKGTVGMGRVIDITLVDSNGEFSGKSNLEAGSDKLIAHTFDTRITSGGTDIYAIAAYSYQDIDQSVRQRQNISAHMVNRFTPCDRLFTDITQQYNGTRMYPGDGINKTSFEKYMARLRYFHDFPNSSELLFGANCQYTDNPHTTILNDASETKGISSVFAFLLAEFTTPIIAGMSATVGWEYDFDYSRHKSPDATHKFDHSNNDLYAQVKYNRGMWRFCIGDRVSFYHYGSPNGSHCDTRNNIEASAIAAFSPSGQMQLAYHRKFLNPSFLVDEDLSNDEWLLIKQSLTATYIDEINFAYTLTRSNMVVNVSSAYVFMQNADNFWQIGSSIYYKLGILNLTAGTNIYANEHSNKSFATFHLAPRLSLPYDIHAASSMVFTTSNTSLPHGEDVYCDLKIDKEIGSHWKVMAEWHDIFTSRYSAFTGGVQYSF